MYVNFKNFVAFVLHLHHDFPPAVCDSSETARTIAGFSSLSVSLERLHYTQYTDPDTHMATVRHKANKFCQWREVTMARRHLEDAR